MFKGSRLLKVFCLEFILRGKPQFYYSTQGQGVRFPFFHGIWIVLKCIFQEVWAKLEKNLYVNGTFFANVNTKKVMAYLLKITHYPIALHLYSYYSRVWLPLWVDDVTSDRLCAYRKESPLSTWLLNKGTKKLLTSCSPIMPLCMQKPNWPWLHFTWVPRMVQPISLNCW